MKKIFILMFVLSVCVPAISFASPKSKSKSLCIKEFKAHMGVFGPNLVVPKRNIRIKEKTGWVRHGRTQVKRVVGYNITGFVTGYDNDMDRFICRTTMQPKSGRGVLVKPRITKFKYFTNDPNQQTQ